MQISWAQDTTKSLVFREICNFTLLRSILAKLVVEYIMYKSKEDVI